MENNLPVISKRIYSMVRVVFFMLRKGFSKGKLVTELNLMLKLPRKLAGNAIANLISHHHHCHHGAPAAPHHDFHLQFSTASEYEFSCGTTPKHSLFPKRHIPRHLFACAHAPLTLDNDTAAVNIALKVALEILDDKKLKDVEEPSPAISGSGLTQTVRQLRVTDSPLPVQDGNDDDQVDKAAEEFIERFFKELRKQG